MINVNYTSSGSSTFTIPFAVISIRAICIGAGGSGNADNDGDALGGGGGGGAYCAGDHNVTSGQQWTIDVGAGGSAPPDSSSPGGLTRIRYAPTGQSTVAFGGTGGSGGGGSPGGTCGGTTDIANLPGRDGGDEDDFYQAGGSGSCGAATALRAGRGGNAGNLNGDCGYREVSCVPGGESRFAGNGGKGIGLGQSGQPCPTNGVGGTYGGGGGGTGTGATSQAGNGGSGGARIQYSFEDPVIGTFTVAAQNSTTGVPSSVNTCSWTGVQFATDLRIRDAAFGSPGNLLADNLVYDANGNGSVDLDTGLTSEAGVTSPAQKTLYLVARQTRAGQPNVGTSVSATANVRNDNNPTSVVNQDNTQTVDGTELSALEPDEVYSIRYRPTGVDMNTRVTAGTDTEVSLNNSTFGNTRLTTTATNNEFYVRFTSPEFNTSRTPGGTDSNGKVIGQTNSKNISFTCGTDTVTVTVTTRAPVIQEDFNYEGQPLSPNAYPDPDIDTLEPDVNQPYIFSNTVISDDAEIGVEIKTDDPDTQVSVNSGGYQDMREIGTPPSS